MRTRSHLKRDFTCALIAIFLMRSILQVCCRGNFLHSTSLLYSHILRLDGFLGWEKEVFLAIPPASPPWSWVYLHWLRFWSWVEKSRFWGYNLNILTNYLIYIIFYIYKYVHTFHFPSPPDCVKGVVFAWSVSGTWTSHERTMFHDMLTPCCILQKQNLFD